MADNGKRYNDDFKADTIRMIKENGRSVNSVAKDLGTHKQVMKSMSWTKSSVMLMRRFPVV